MNKRRWTDNQLIEAVKNNDNYKAVILALGLTTVSGNHLNIKAHMARLNLDISHFSTAAERMRETNRCRRRSLSEILCKNSSYNRVNLKNRLYSEGIKTRFCELCGQGELWQDKRMSLILDHINGDNSDCRLYNLRIICPNCNATLDTYAGKNVKKWPLKICKGCGDTFMGTTNWYCSDFVKTKQRIPIE